MTRRAPALASGVALLAVALMGAGVSPDASGLVDQDVHAALAGGLARVLVELRLPDGAPGSGEAAPRDTEARRAAITAVQQAVLGRLVGTSFRPIRQYATVPLLALEVTASAVRALETMGDLVVRVRLDRPRSPSGTP